MYNIELEIEGMKCGMCEAHVNDAIRKEFPMAKKVKSNHRKNLTKFVSMGLIDEKELRKVVENLGYVLKRINVCEK